jgi:hypothetical protein
VLRKSLRLKAHKLFIRMDSSYASKHKCFRNIRHTATFGTLLRSSRQNTLLYQWKSHLAITISGVLLHYEISKHSTCPLNEFIYASKVVKLFLKQHVWLFLSHLMVRREYKNGWLVFTGYSGSWHGPMGGEFL